MSLANAKIGQILIPVELFDTAVAFYKDVLGLPFLFAAPPQMAFFSCGHVQLLVGVVPSGQKAQRGSAIYFQVADIHGTFVSLRDNGVQFLAEPHVVNRTPKSEIWLAEFVDPDGNQLALMSEVSLGAAAHMEHLPWLRQSANVVTLGSDGWFSNRAWPRRGTSIHFIGSPWLYAVRAWRVSIGAGGEPVESM